MKKFLVLGVLFLLPILAYLFFSSGVNHFAKLPILTNQVKDVNHFQTNQDSAVSFQDKISIVAFFGNDPDDLKGNTFNLDQKILEKFYQFKDFQFVIVLPEDARPQAQKFIKDFSAVTNSGYWKMVYGTPKEVSEVFNSFQTNLQLDENLQTPYVFIIDKDENLRGRDTDEDTGMLYGYDSRSVSELNNKMNDDVKVILAEYRLALKKYNKKEEK
ncbi:hypothetical protein [Gillisia limnaea]|uniref:Membrane or secreted protein n=1 Tax=Gillisia limnaea (strain DSM 15749 / LMG 21470 / R-8282) TaxID=865937 RepID=H2BYH8_GILLR|nr:hypothetical protein [Gillisia limnaea]EHQ03317.1 membrane or secreted protein [Gillisia limnaea DSM 15749]